MDRFAEVPHHGQCPQEFDQQDPDQAFTKRERQALQPGSGEPSGQHIA